MKKQLILAGAAAGAAALLAACAQPAQPATTLTLWVGPVGAFSAVVDDHLADTPRNITGPLVKAFTQNNPDIGVNVEVLTTDAITTRLQNGERPDLLLDSTERILRMEQDGVAWADLSDYWTDTILNDVNAVSPAIAPACRDSADRYRVAPLAVMVDCMAVNRELFADAGVDAILDDRTWTVGEFYDAMWALRSNETLLDNGLLATGSISGDQGTRMLVQNLAGIPFTDPQHRRYTLGGQEALDALITLNGWCDEKLLRYEEKASSIDELTLFADGSTAFSLCWNADNQANYAAETSFVPYAMAFPSVEAPKLYGTVWGFALPEGGNTQAALRFVQYACTDPTGGTTAVRLTGQLPAHASLGNVWADTPDEARMAEFAALLPYLDDLYGVTPGWSDQRQAWYTLITTTLSGALPPEEALAQYEATVARLR